MARATRPTGPLHEYFNIDESVVDDVITNDLTPSGTFDDDCTLVKLEFD